MIELLSITNDILKLEDRITDLRFKKSQTENKRHEENLNALNSLLSEIFNLHSEINFLYEASKEKNLPNKDELILNKLNKSKEYSYSQINDFEQKLALQKTIFLESQKENLLKNKIDEEEKTAKVLNEKINSLNKEIKIFSKYEEKILKELFKGQNQDKKCSESFNKSPTKHILFKEIFTGLHVTKRENLSCSLFDPPSYEISIQCLPEDYLDSEKKSSLETGTDETSPVKYSVTDSAVNKKKIKKMPIKQAKVSTNKNCLVVRSLKDFNLIFSNFTERICSVLTKLEINEALKQFAIDWVEGSKLVTILINNKSSKMATLLLPKYYPFTGTSVLRLTSLSDYESSQIKDFQLNESTNSLLEWITVFTKMYNKDMICPKTENI